MSDPTLTPKSVLSTVVLPQTGSAALVDTSVPYKIYTDSNSPLYSSEFLSGAVDQVSYVYKKLGGDVLDIELTEGNVYTAYEEAVLEYSYLVNIHQATNILPDALGNTTGSFDDKGNLMSGSLKDSLSGSHVSLKYPKFDYAMTRRIAEGISSEIGLKASEQYSASFDIVTEQQDYDLNAIITAAETGSAWEGKLQGKKILIKKVFYKTPHAMWRFYGYYGGLNVVGNLHNYGQFSDDSSFELVPAWQNKQQALSFEDSIYTRMSHFSYEIRNNDKLRIFPTPRTFSPRKMWIEFSIPHDAWDSDDKSVDGVNNMNTLPLGNLPFNNINAIGKQWIRRFALSLCKEMLGQIRSKFGQIPVPGSSISLNGSALLNEAKQEQDKLRDELKKTLEELTYVKLSEHQGKLLENAEKVLQDVPNFIFVG